MLFSIALAPGVLAPAAAQSPSQLRALTSVLRAITQNGILVVPDISQLKAGLLGAAAAASGPVAQRFTLLVEELTKNLNRFAVSSAHPTLTGYAQYAAVSAWGRCDAIVVLDEDESQRCINEGMNRDRVVLLEEFSDSAIEHTRSSWLLSQRLDTLSDGDASSIVGRVLRFSKSLVVADKMIGVSIKNGKESPYHRAKQAEPYLSGIKYLVNAWKRASPYSTQAALNVEVVTVALGSGARGGFIDPKDVKAAISAAASSIGLDRDIGGLSIILKGDSRPSSFNYRLLATNGRVWGLQHGLDDFGRLGQGGQTRATILDPSSNALSSVFRDIQALGNA